MNRKKVILGLFGAAFLLLGLYYSNISYEYIGIGTWSAGVIFYAFFPKYKEIASLILGLLILHSGVVLLLIEKISNPKLVGLLVFASGVVVVLNSGFSDYLKRRKKRSL